MTASDEQWRGSFAALMGVSYRELEPGRSVAELEVRPEHCNPNGVCHGGAVFTLADDSMGAALHALGPPGHVPIATEVDIHLVRSTRAGERLRVETTVPNHGRRTALAHSRVTDRSGRLVALVTAGYLFVEAGVVAGT